MKKKWNKIEFVVVFPNHYKGIITITAYLNQRIYSIPNCSFLPYKCRKGRKVVKYVSCVSLLSRDSTLLKIFSLFFFLSFSTLYVSLPCFCISSPNFYFISYQFFLISRPNLRKRIKGFFWYKMQVVKYWKTSTYRLLSKQHSI